MTQYTLVQHSGYGYAGKPGFARAVEMRSIQASQVKAVLAAGGVVFDSYGEADTAEEAANFPPGVEGLYPQTRGEFHRKLKVDNLALYIPHPIHYVVDPEADSTWVAATLRESDEILVEDASIIAVQREKYPDGTVKVEWRWVLGTYDRYADRTGEKVNGHKIVTIQSVMDLA